MTVFRQILAVVTLVAAALLLCSLADGTPSAASVGAPAVPQGSSEPSLSPDDSVFIEQARDGAPTLTVNASDTDLLDFAHSIRDACFAGVSLDDMMAGSGDTEQETIEIGNLFRLALAVYCTQGVPA